MADTKNESPDGHWSVDFVEHLRTVHFALAALSVTLMVLAAPPDKSISRALTEAWELQSVQEHWDVNRRSLYRAAAKNIGQPFPGFTVERQLTPNSPHEFVVSLSIDSLLTTENIAAIFPGDSMQEPPVSIVEFESWWDALRSTGIRVNVVRPEAGQTNCTAEEMGTTTGIPIRKSLCLVGPASHMFFSESKTSIIVVATKDSATAMFTLMDVRNAYTRPNRKWTVEMFMTADRVNLTQTAIRDFFPPKAWIGGTQLDGMKFAQAFPDLAGLPEELKIISIKDAIPRVADLQAKGEQYVEILGVKVPTGGLVQWGSLLMLACQLYFWLHVHELRQRLEPNGPGLYVAWIGVYESRCAFSVVTLSACLLPVMAIAALVGRAGNLLSPAVVISALALVGGTMLALFSFDELVPIRQAIARADGDPP